MKTESLCRDMLSDSCIAERPRYFPRQLITPADMTLEQEYFRNKLRRHNRLLHGWGVVCGALVCPMPKAKGDGLEPWKVIVRPGYILGPYGDEIMIDCDRTLDLRTMCLTGVTGDPCVEPADPWCSEVFVKRERGPLYVAVKYKEIMARPVRVQPIGCGCDETQCEYSRVCDGYEVCVLTECPESHKNPPKLDLEELANKGSIPQCPPCPSEPWVVLAKVEVDENGMIKKIDNCECRRMVISFGHFWWKCTADLLMVTNVVPMEVNIGDKGKLLTISGSNFKEGLSVDLGQGITVSDITVETDKKVAITINVSTEASPGPHSLTVINPNCSTAAWDKAIIVAGKTSPSTPQLSKEETTKKRRRRGEEKSPE